MGFPRLSHRIATFLRFWPLVMLVLAGGGVGGVHYLARWMSGQMVRPSPGYGWREPSPAARALVTSGRQVARFATVVEADFITRFFAEGSPAPAFTLPQLGGDKAISLADYRGRPVVLMFGSFSCDRFLTHIPRLRGFETDYSEHAEFLFVNITEAGHKLSGLEYLVAPFNPQDGDLRDQRRARVQRAMQQLKFTTQSVLDVNGAMTDAYQAWPLRLIAIDGEGRIALDLGRDVFERWDLKRLQHWLESLPSSSEEPTKSLPHPRPTHTSH